MTRSIFWLFLIAFTSLQCSKPFKFRQIYNSPDLVITQIEENSFIHTSFKQTNDFGNVPCNGLLVRNGKEVIVFDTPANNQSSTTLIRWITDSLQCRITAIVPTHFHDDCLGGLNAFEKMGIPSYAHSKTIELAGENNVPVPQNPFNDSLVLMAGEEIVIVKFLGEGHTSDNVVGYFPADNVLFGGCLIKETGATKGYLADANLTDWALTVEKVKGEFPDAKIVVPGHGDPGDQQLLDYTIQLFRK